MGTALVTDVNGIVTGQYRMVHRYPFSGRFHGVECRDGKSVGTVTGLAARKLVAQGWRAHPVTAAPAISTDPASTKAPGDAPDPSVPALAEAESVVESVIHDPASDVVIATTADNKAVVSKDGGGTWAEAPGPAQDFVADLEAQPVVETPRAAQAVTLVDRPRRPKPRTPQGAQ